MIDFNQRCIKYDPTITIEIFQKIWNKLYAMGWVHIYSTPLSTVYEEFKSHSPYLEPSSRSNKFQVYSSGSHTASYSELLVSDFLKGEVSPSKFSTGDAVIFYKFPTDADWGNVGHIKVPFEEGEVLIVNRTGTSSGGIPVIGLKQNTLGSYPASCFKLAAVPDIIKYAKKKYPKGTKFSALGSSDAKNNGSFDWEIQGENYTWYPDSEVICCNGNIFCKGIWAPIKEGSSSLIEKARANYPEGTEIISSYSGKRFIIKGGDFTINSDGDVIGKSTFGGPVIYCKSSGKWSEIVGFTGYQPPYPIGTEVLVVDAVKGAYGANGLTGKITDKPINAGNASSNLRIETSIGKVWGIGDTAVVKPITVTIVAPTVDKKSFTDTELLDYAYKNYPIGTSFKSTINENDKGIERVIKPYLGHREITWRIIDHKTYGRCVYADNGLDDSSGGCSNPCIYSEKKGWVPIIHSPKLTSMREDILKPKMLYSVGQMVRYGSKVYRIAGIKYRTKAYILEYPGGWDCYDPDDWDEGTYERGKCYFFADEREISPTLFTPLVLGSKFKIGDRVKITSHNVEYGMDGVKVGTIGTVKSRGTRPDSVYLTLPDVSYDWQVKESCLSLAGTSTTSFFDSILNLRVTPPLSTVFWGTPSPFSSSGEGECLEDEEGVLPDLVFVANTMDLPLKKKAKIKVPKKEIVFI